MHGTNIALTAQEAQSASIEELSIQRANEIRNNHLPSPLPLQREPGNSKPFPFEALGETLGSAAQRIHEIVKAPDSVCGQSVLAVAALVAQPYADIFIDGRMHPLSLFMLTVAESGDRKSAVDSIVLKPLREYEKMLKKTHEQEKKTYKNKLEIWKKQREQLMREPDLTELEHSLNKMEAEPTKPLDPYLLMDEPTYEGLVKLLDVGLPSIGLFSDEGGRMFGGYAMGKENVQKTASGLSSLWDGKPISRVRGGDENLLLYGKRFSIHLMIQEVVMTNILKSDILTGQGLLARCLTVAPASNAGKRGYNPTDVSKDPAIVKFSEQVSNLLDQPYPLADPDVKNELAPRLLELDSTAKDLWICFHNEVDLNLQTDGTLWTIKSTASKAAEQALRIAGVLTIFDNFYAESIALDTMQRAIALVRFYLDEAIRIVDMSASNPDLDLAKGVLNWMQKQVATGKNNKFSLKDIYQNAGPRGVRNKQSAQKIMAVLEDHEQIQRIEGNNLAWRLSRSSN